MGRRAAWSLAAGAAVAALGTWGALSQHGAQAPARFAAAHHQTIAQAVTYGAVEVGGVVAVAVFLLASIASAARRR